MVCTSLVACQSFSVLVPKNLCGSVTCFDLRQRCCLLDLPWQTLAVTNLWFFLLFQRLCSELIEKQTNPTFKTRLANALHALTSSNQLSSTLDRINHKRFRQNLLKFLIEVRGFLRMVWRIFSRKHDVYMLIIFTL